MQEINTRILLEMSSRRPSNVRHNTPPDFLVRLRDKRSPRPPAWLDWTYLLPVIAILGVCYLLWLLSPILTPFLAAAILAYIFDPLVDRLELRGVSRTLGTVIAILMLLLGVVALLLIILPLFAKESAQLAQEIPSFVDKLKTSFIPWINEKLGVTIALDISSFRQFVTENASDATGVAKRILASVGVGGLAVVGFLINLLLIPVVLFYVLRDWDVLIKNIDESIPRRFHATISTVGREIDAVLSEFLRGQLSVMAIMAVFYVVGLKLVGLELALPVGLITGLLVFIPYLGSGTGLLLGTVAAVMQFPSLNGVVLVWVVFTIGQLIEGLAVTPWLVGERIGLHPVVVLFALLAFGQIFGFFGVLLALPASAAMLVGLRHVQTRYRKSSLYRD